MDDKNEPIPFDRKLMARLFIDGCRLTKGDK